MYVAAPERGREFLQKLSAEHLSTPVVERAREWLLAHPDSPLSGLPRDDEELVALVTQVKMMSEREPASEEAMEINFLELEQRMVEQRIEAAQGAGGEALVALQRQRADLAERIARRAAAARSSPYEHMFAFPPSEPLGIVGAMRHGDDPSTQAHNGLHGPREGDGGEFD